MKVTKEEVDMYLKSAKKLARKNCFIVIPRDKNNEFRRKYKLTNSKIKNIINLIEPDNFINIKDSKEIIGHKLWEFCIECELEEYGNMSNVIVYIKMDNTGNNIRLDIVSMHEAEFNTNYYFKGGV